MAESIAALASPHGNEGRRDDRTHMFVAATLSSTSSSCPVHIRNMSRSGALIEGADLPERNASVTLRRGSLQAAAKIAWRAGRKAGISFCATVQAADWMSRNPQCHQARVDEIVRGIRNGTSRQEPAPDVAAPASIDCSRETELSLLKEELVQLEKGLCADVDLIARHPEIQLLEMAIQRVGRLLAGGQRR